MKRKLTIAELQTRETLSRIRKEKYLRRIVHGIG